MKTKLLTTVLLAVVFCMALRRPQSETDRDLAKDLLGSEEVQQLRLSDAGDLPVFQAGSRVALFFERKGVQGPIRGVVMVQDDHVVDLLVLQSREGLEHDALNSSAFRTSFRGKPAKAPLVVDAVSGATISSQAVMDAVNARLEQWETYTQPEAESKQLLQHELNDFKR